MSEVQKISFDCLSYPSLGHWFPEDPKKLKKFQGFTEEMLMAQVMRGAVNLLQALGDLRSHVEVIKLRPLHDSSPNFHAAINVRFTLIFDRLGGESKVEVQGGIMVCHRNENNRYPSYYATIHSLPRALVQEGLDAVRDKVTELDEGLVAAQEALRTQAPFAFKQEPVEA